jgi:hypothetical protein
LQWIFSNFIVFLKFNLYGHQNSLEDTAMDLQCEYLLSGVCTGEQTVNTCCCHWQWKFEKIGNLLLKLHCSAKLPDLLLIWIWAYNFFGFLSFGRLILGQLAQKDETLSRLGRSLAPGRIKHQSCTSVLKSLDLWAFFKGYGIK